MILSSISFNPLFRQR